MKNFRTYTENNTDLIAFPIGGFGAGMFCVQGSGAFGQFSVRNRPNLLKEPYIFSAVWVKDGEESHARIVEGQIPLFRRYRWGESNMGCGFIGSTYGLPRFTHNTFTEEFPFANVKLTDTNVPIEVHMSAYNPFTPGNADDSSLPVGIINYTFINPTDRTLDLVYSINSDGNFMEMGKAKKYIYPTDKGFVLHQDPEPKDITAQGDFYFYLDDEDAVVNTDWFNGGWFDAKTQRWNAIRSGENKPGKHPENLSPGGSASVSFSLKAGEKRTVSVKCAWYVPNSDVTEPWDVVKEGYKPWYAGRFKDVHEVMDYLCTHEERLYKESRMFADTLNQVDLPDEIMESVRANLSILKSPTILRQTDGKLWGWEGCFTNWCVCAGSCTHVWNYAQAICHLFPELERSLRNTEFFMSQNEEGHQQFRSFLPIAPAVHNYHAASDGQMGGIMKLYREWRISGDDSLLTMYWDKMVESIEYAIRTWDKTGEGVFKEPHHNTYDIEFWGADSMCSSFYLGALKAMTIMGEKLGKDIKKYSSLYEKGKAYVEEKLFNGEYFYQQVEWETLEAELKIDEKDKQTAELLKKEGPKYQYGTGCLSDGLVGAWLAKCCGLGDILDVDKMKKHLKSVHRYNLKDSMLCHENPQRAGYALGDEGGLLLCSWPYGGKPSLPFVYSDEVWTGIEHQVASHMLFLGLKDEALDIERKCRSRYDGIRRNPFDEFEWGDWYARAMASYSLMEAYTGVKYDKVDKKLYVSTRNSSDYKVLLCTDGGYGLVCMKNGKAELEIVSGTIEVAEIVYI